MKCQDAQEIPLRPVEIEGAIGVSMRWLISQKEAPNFAMRLFELAQDGHTPLHTHPTEHEVFILAGQGELTYENAKKPFQAGYVIYIEPNKLHQFRNTGPGILKFLCMIPNK
jgi:quercetin dioxygenase-like cupin family protein